MIRALAQCHYSTDTILRAILLLTEVENSQEIAKELTDLTKKVKSEREFLDRVEEIEQINQIDGN